MRYRVQSNGLVTGTTITNADTGELIGNVFRVEFSHDAREIPTLILHMHALDVEIDVSVAGEMNDITGLDDKARRHRRLAIGPR